MKRLSTIIMALAVIMCMTQCTKPAMQLYDGSYTGVTKDITFSTGGSSKVTVDNSIASELHFKWQGTDNLYVYGSQLGDFSDGQYCGSLALVKGEGTENGFFSGTLDNVPTSGKLRFYYSATALDGTEKSIDLSSQNGSLGDIASRLVAYADVAVKPDGGDYSATLAVPYSVVKFDLSAFGSCDVTMTGTTNKGLTISAKGVKGVTAGTSTTLSGVTSGSTSYYVAVMPESVTTLNFSGNGKVGSKTVTLTENTFETLNGGGGVPVPAAEPLYLSGDFTVNSSGDKVKFSRGNLWYGTASGKDGAAFHFESNQWDFLPTADGTWNTDHVSHFYWCKSSAEAVKEEFDWEQEMSTTDVFFTNTSETEGSFTVDGVPGWRTLSYDEWQYLLWTRVVTVSGEQKASYGEGSVNGVNGLIILPDNWDGSVCPSFTYGDSEWSNTFTESTNPRWSAMESAGAVFLPAAGYRFGTDVCDVGSHGDYWSSTPFGSDGAYGMSFDSGNVGAYYYFRDIGNCVRLVR